MCLRSRFSSLYSVTTGVRVAVHFCECYLNTMKLALWLGAYVIVCPSIFAFAPQGKSQTYQGKELIKAELLADTDAVVSGKPFTIGLLLRIAPGWHMYWKFPGDAGLPTEIKWNLPVGWKAGEIQWPIPLKTNDRAISKPTATLRVVWAERIDRRDRADGDSLRPVRVGAMASYASPPLPDLFVGRGSCVGERDLVGVVDASASTQVIWASSIYM